MFKSPYATTVASKLRTDNIQTRLMQALVEGRLIHPVVPGVDALYAVVGKDPMIAEIDAFTHPMTINRQGKEITVIDLRAYSVSSSENGVMIPKVGPAALLVKQALLQIIWRQSPESFIPLIEIPMSVYANWLGGAIGRSASLDPQTTLEVKIIAGWFFSCLFMDKAEFERGNREDVVAQKATKIARTLRVPFENVQQAIERYGFLESITDFTKALTEHGSTRLDRMNNTLLTQMVGASWFGTPAAREMISVALEFPPTFFGVIHTAATESTFKKAVLAELTLNQKYRDNLHHFDLGINTLLESAKE